MSLIELRKEFVRLQKEFAGGRATKLKKHEIEHRLEILKKAMTMKGESEAPEPARTGPPSAREIPTENVVIDGETLVKKPLKPEGPDPAPKKPRGPNKKKTPDTDAKEQTDTSVEETTDKKTKEKGPTAVKEVKAVAGKKETKVPPKVIFTEASVKEQKPQETEKVKVQKPPKAPK